jgi:hypothetical protein
MYVWNVDNNEYTNLLLWRTEKDAFRVIQDGKYSPILNNGSYTLINRKYEDIFLLAFDQINTLPIKIHDYQFNTVVEDYIELTILNLTSPETIHIENKHGYKVWGYDRYIFVSQELKEELEKVAGNELSFSSGFSLFGA